MDTDIHIKGCGGASIVVLSLWSENSAKLAVFYGHGYSHKRVWGCFHCGSFSLQLELGEVSSILCTRIFTEEGVGVLPLWFFLSAVRTQRS